MGTTRLVRSVACEHRRGRLAGGPSSSRATLTTLAAIETVSASSLDAEKDDYEQLFALARPKLEPGGVVAADNVLSTRRPGAYSRRRQSDRGS